MCTEMGKNADLKKNLVATLYFSFYGLAIFSFAKVGLKFSFANDGLNSVNTDNV